MKAFTLTEMLITLIILGILSGIMFALPNYTRQEYDLINAAQRMAGDVQRTQGLALATAIFKGAPAEGGWGIFIDPSQACYVIFQDTDKDRSYDGPAGADLCNQAKTGPEISERIYFPADIKFGPGTYTGAGSTLTLVFTPPHPDSFINGADWLLNVNAGTTPSTIPIVVTLLSGENKTITVNVFGLVEVR